MNREERGVKKLIWKIKYAYFMWRQTRPPLKFFWDSACAAAEEEDILNEPPIEAVENELSNWGR